MANYDCERIEVRTQEADKIGIAKIEVRLYFSEDPEHYRVLVDDLLVGDDVVVDFRKPGGLKVTDLPKRRRGEE